MKSAVQMGAGNIGRGFIGMLLSQAGYKVTFADVQEEMVKQLASKGEYEVEVVGDNKNVVTVKNVDAKLSSDPALIDILAEADVVTTAVGPPILKFISPNIVKAIKVGAAQGRTKPLNVIACENAVRATSQLKKLVVDELDTDLPDWVNFVDAAVDRIVPPMEAGDDITKVRVEEFCEWLVEEAAFKGQVPEIAGMTPVENLEAGVERKLFTLNTGHAVCAWIGQYLGFPTIKEAIEDETVARLVKGIMTQSGDALVAKHGFSPEAHAAYIEKILKRFANPYIIDSVERVGRQPVRKLTKGERIASPVTAAMDNNLPYDKLLLGAAAAMYFKSDEDPQVGELKDMLKSKSPGEVFDELSGLTGLGAKVEAFYNDMEKAIKENL
ncbi:MAG: mannitol-1-phosphate 5-dehydrogenase [Spirochaetales bacterium]|nr:mannitol-1-phosphate 5-dehydrogenase [Spirochaetales bacterium]